MTSQIEQSFLRQLQSLPADTQRLLLIATAQVVGDVDLLWRAAGRLGIGADAAAPAEAAGLIELGAQVRFRHPLVRSAVYRAASLRDRRAVHRALAEATDPDVDPDRRAWHRAQAAAGPDEAVADELERSADRARGRGGVAAAAAFLERATELTPDPARRGARALAAAQAKFEAAAPDAASELLALAEIVPAGRRSSARDSRGCAARSSLRAGAGATRRRCCSRPRSCSNRSTRRWRARPISKRSARRSSPVASAVGCGELEVAEAARAASSTLAARRAPPICSWTRSPRDSPRVPRRARPCSSGRSTRSAERRQRGEDDIRWLWLACRVAPDLWDDETWHRLAVRQVQLANEAGALTVLPIAATYRAGVHVHAGEFAAAEALIEQADATADAAGIAPLHVVDARRLARSGGEAVTLLDAGVRDATARGEGRAVALAAWGNAVLYNGLGRYEARSPPPNRHASTTISVSSARP